MATRKEPPKNKNVEKTGNILKTYRMADESAKRKKTKPTL